MVAAPPPAFPYLALEPPLDGATRRLSWPPRVAEAAVAVAAAATADALNPPPRPRPPFGLALPGSEEAGFLLDGCKKKCYNRLE